MKKGAFALNEVRGSFYTIDVLKVLTHKAAEHSFYP